jgi:hypothetical protein
MKLFASDYDGTLCFHDKKNVKDGYYKEEDMKAIQEWQKAGHLFGICTGRALDSIMDSVKIHDGIQPDFYIASSGAVIADGNGKVLYADYLPYSLLEEIVKATNGDHMFIACKEGYVPLSKHIPSFIIGGSDNTIHTLSEFKEDPVETASFEYESEQELYLDLPKLSPFKDQLSFYINQTSIDLVAKGHSKATGIKKAAKLLGIQEENLYCMGDSYNDLPMIEALEKSFTFLDAPQELQKAAGKCVKSLADAINYVNSYRNEVF